MNIRIVLRKRARSASRNGARALWLALSLAIWWAGGVSAAPPAGYEPREGDIVLQALPANPLVQAIEGVTQSPLAHCGVVVREGSDWVVVEALNTVKATPLHRWESRSRHGQYDVYRLRAPEQLDARRLKAALAPFMGRPYDLHYAPGDEQLYCSELVYRAFEEGLGLKLGKWDRLADLNWKPHEAFIRFMEGGQLPLDRPMITPVGLTRSDLLECVYENPVEE